ncbi:enoyl-CoA hydratase/isomerase family protein [Burkholderia sp. PU8-34]
MSEALLVARHGSVAQITMNQPERRNALSVPLYTALAETLARLQDDTSVRAVVLYGGNHFCAGGDLSGLDASPLGMRRAMIHGHRIVRALTGGPWPVVAAVEGNAYGAGLSLALACDFVVADESARFCAAFGRVGLTPDYGLMWTLPQRVGIGVTREMLMLCEPIGGADAKQLGLVDRLCPPSTVLQNALDLAERVAGAPPGTIATTKTALARYPMQLDTMLAWEADTQSVLVHSEDFAEGVNAFMDKRAPKFVGR